MVGCAFGIEPNDGSFAALRDEFLQRYEARMTRETRVFTQMVPVLQMLAARAMPWGIVTNKATRFSAPLVRSLDLLAGAATLVCGDTTPHSKPHPEPLLEAARRIGVAPGQCCYVGDDLRDVQAGRAAGMVTIAVRWGYLGQGEPVEGWGADHIAATPNDLLKLLGMA
jgi:phosphoglycolate phosphatase